jgi:hypothetical protein
MRAWDCSSNDVTNMMVLDSNPEIQCKLSDKEWGIMLFFSIVFAIFYCIATIIWLLHKIFPPSRTNKGILIGWGFPHWTDKHFCNDYIDKLGPCYQCEACDQRQRFAFLFEKYHSNYFYWELFAVLRKTAIAIPNLFLTTQLSMSLSIQCFINLCFIIALCRYQPFLTDAEYEYSHRHGRLAFLRQDDRKICSKKACGANTFLDVMLLIGEMALCISALIRELTYEDFFKNSQNSNSSTVFVLIHEDVVEAYPSMEAVTSTFDWIGIVMFGIGFLFFFKESFLWIGKLCRKKCKKRIDITKKREQIESERKLQKEKTWQKK